MGSFYFGEKNKLMKFIFLLIAFLFSVILQAQTNSGVLEYQILTIMEYGIDGKLAGLAEQDTSLAKKLTQQIDSFMEDKSTSSSDTIGNVNMVYHFDNEKVRIIGNPIYRTEAFEIYDLQTLQKEVRRMIKGKLNVDTLFYQSLENRTYEISMDSSDNRNILGFDCFKVNVVKTESLSNTEIKTTYEMYVTKDVLFPPSIVCNWSQNIIPYCALQIKEWVNDDKQNYNFYSAKFIQKNLDTEVFNIPQNMMKN